MQNFLKGIVYAAGCLLGTGAVAMVMAGNDLRTAVAFTLFIGVALTLVVFLRTVFGSNASAKTKSSKKSPFLNPGAEEWGPDSSHSSSPHGW